jgi:hypothetical protein
MSAAPTEAGACPNFAKGADPPGGEIPGRVLSTARTPQWRRAVPIPTSSLPKLPNPPNSPPLRNAPSPDGTRWHAEGVRALN